MSRTDILVKIKNAEEAADQKVEWAHADKKVAVADARRDSVNRIQKANTDAKAKTDSAIAKELEVLGAKRQEELDKGKSEAAALEKASKKNVGKAKKFLMDEFARTLDAVS